MTQRRGQANLTRIAAPVAAIVLMALAVVVVVRRQGDGSTAEGPSGTGVGAQRTGWPPYPADLRPPALDWGACADRALADLQCATLTVPLDYGRPEGDHIPLAVARRPAGRPGDRLGTLIVSPGGARARGIPRLADVGRGLGAEVLDRFDLVSWDPRGTAGASALTCDAAGFAFFDLDLGQTRPARTVDDAAGAWGAACQSRHEALLPDLGAVPSAYDAESLRRALGDETVSLAGLSYGSAVALAYAERFPDRLRALLLDGVVDPSIDARRLVIEHAAAVERSVDQFVEWCGDAPDCAVRGEAAAALDRAYAQSRAAPLRGTVAGAERPLLPSYVNFAVTGAAEDQGRWPELATALARATAGDGTGLARLADGYLGRTSLSAALAGSCLDTPVPTGEDFDRLVEETARVAPRTGAFLANGRRPCAHWPVAPKGAPASVRLTTAPTVEVWGTTGDSVTPYPNASHVASMLDRVRLVTLEGERHTAVGANECVVKWQSAYLLRLEVPMDGTRC